MREKLLWITVTILGVMLASSHAQSPKQDTAPPQTSRYQLVAVPNSKEEVYRIDTATGKTWVKINLDNFPAWVGVQDPAHP
jgi:hypothetical protein